MRIVTRGAALGLSLVLLGACSGGGDGESVTDDQDPEEVLSTAKQTLDETSGVRIALSTPSLPDGVTGITKAEGIGTSQPAFDGSITVVLLGNSVNVPVIAVNEKVYAVVPLTDGFQEVDPGEYGAPDPAQLLTPDAGLSTLLTETTGAEKGESVRGGSDNSEVLTEYSGTVPDTAAKNVIPSAKGDFEADYLISDDGELRQAVLTGQFYGDSDPVTYTIKFSEYGNDREISAP